VFGEVGKARTDGKTEYFDFFRRHTAISDDGRALFVGDDKIISRRPIPNRVHTNRVGNDGDIFTATFISQNLLQHIGIGWKGRDDDVRLKTVEEAAQIFLEAAESLEPSVEILFSIEPVVNVAPRFGPMVDQS